LKVRTADPTKLAIRSREDAKLYAVMNNTKWDDLRIAMDGLGAMSPSWRTKDLSGYVSALDRDWYYHFRDGGYSSIEWVEIIVTTAAQHATVEAALRCVHVPGQRLEYGFRVYGYAADRQALAYL
jgi:hypothetical protein